MFLTIVGSPDISKPQIGFSSGRPHFLVESSKVVLSPLSMGVSRFARSETFTLSYVRSGSLRSGKAPRTPARGIVRNSISRRLLVFDMVFSLAGDWIPFAAYQH